MKALKSDGLRGDDFAGVIADHYQRHHNLLKYFAIGCMASAIDVGIFLVLFNVVGTSALMAHSVSVPTSILFSFLVNARHNFSVNDYMAIRLVSFFVVCGLGYAVGFAVISAAVSGGLSANAGKIVSLPIVFVLQYLLNSRITFASAERFRFHPHSVREK